MNESKQLYVFKVDERCFCVTGTAIIAADTKEEARCIFYGLKSKDTLEVTATPINDILCNESFVNSSYTKVLFHKPEKINRFLTVVWCLDYEFLLRVPVKKGLKSISYSD